MILFFLQKTGEKKNTYYLIFGLLCDSSSLLIPTKEIFAFFFLFVWNIFGLSDNLFSFLSEKKLYKDTTYVYSTKIKKKISPPSVPAYNLFIFLFIYFSTFRFLNDAARISFIKTIFLLIKPLGIRLSVRTYRYRSFSNSYFYVTPVKTAAVILLHKKK